MSPKPRSGEPLEGVVTGLSTRGEGLWAHGEYTVALRGAIPGDRVAAAVSRVKKRRIDARLERIIEPSAGRIDARCRHFELCGGCTLQSLTYAGQLAAKVDMVKAMLARWDVDASLMREPIGLDSPWFYRNKMEFSFGVDAEQRTGLGLHPPGYKYEIFDLAECLLESEEAAALVRAAAQWARDAELAPFVSMRHGGFLRTLTVREGKRTGDRMVELTTTGDAETQMHGRTVEAKAVADAFLECMRASGVPLTSIYWTQHRAVKGERTTVTEHHLHGESVLHEELCLKGREPMRFEIHPRAFFQPNSRGAELLYHQVGIAAGLVDAPGGRLLDLYCGTGTIGLALSPWAKSVMGIELQPDAVENARRNAALNGIENVVFHAGDVAAVLRDLGDVQADVVIVDPPRSGLMGAAREHIDQVGAARLVYVSCNPEALARDLVGLTEAKWVLESIQPVDMFPQTAHIENVVVLTR